jgi:hypothetical protein
MGDNELDRETLSKIGQYITNQEFDKIALDDIKKIEAKIGGKRKVTSIITSNIKPALVIITVFEFVIYSFLLGSSPSTSTVIISFGFLAFFNIFGIGFVLFSISEYGNFRKEHTIFSIFSPLFVMIASLLASSTFLKSQPSLNAEALGALFILALFYFMYTVVVFIIFNGIGDKLIGYLFSRFNTITFDKENTIVFKFDTDIKNDLVYKYIIYMLTKFFNLEFFDSNKSEKYKSIIFSSYDTDRNQANMYDKLIKYYLFMYIDIQNAVLTFAFFKKYFDRLLINDTAIEKNKLLEYYLPNICKNIKKVTIDNFEDINKNFQSFDNELFGKRRGTKMEKIGWLFNKYVIITFFLTVILLAMYSYSLFSSIAGWISLHETLASGIIGAIVVILVQFILRQKTR